MTNNTPNTVTNVLTWMEAESLDDATRESLRARAPGAKFQAGAAIPPTTWMGYASSGERLLSTEEALVLLKRCDGMMPPEVYTILDQPDILTTESRPLDVVLTSLPDNTNEVWALQISGGEPPAIQWRIDRRFVRTRPVEGGVTGFFAGLIFRRDGTNPEDARVNNRLAEVLRLTKRANARTSADTDLALRSLTNAESICDVAFKETRGGSMHNHAASIAAYCKNEREGVEAIVALKRVFDYLVKNEEGERALRLLDCIPHTMEDHPIAVELERWSVAMRKHLTDPAAYRSFYNEDSHSVGAVATDIRRLKSTAVEARTGHLIVRVPHHARVLEVGPFDGSVAIPVLIRRPDLDYAGLEPCDWAREALAKHAETVGRKITVVRGELSLDGIIAKQDLGLFDAVILQEVIEHIQDPVRQLGYLWPLLKPNGRLYLSTPLGSYDRGTVKHPEIVHKDVRGHVRAMSMRVLGDTVRRSGGYVEELCGVHLFDGANQYGQAFKELRQGSAAHTVFVTDVPTPELHERACRRPGLVEVYCRLPWTTEPESYVRDGIAYWPLEQLRPRWVPETAEVIHA